MEVKDIRYVPVDELRKAIEEDPEKYTTWFRIAFPKLETYIASSI